LTLQTTSCKIKLFRGFINTSKLLAVKNDKVFFRLTILAIPNIATAASSLINDSLYLIVASAFSIKVFLSIIVIVPP